MVLSNLDPCDSTPVTTRPTIQLDPQDNSTLVTIQPTRQVDSRDNSTLVTTRPLFLLVLCDKGRRRIDAVKLY